MAALADPILELSRIVRQVFIDMTPLDVVDRSPDAWSSQQLYCASVQMNGVWAGHLALFSEADFITQIAAILMGRHPSDVSSDDARGVWGEMANVIAGHVQHDMPEPKSLGAPAVTPCGPRCVGEGEGTTVWTVVEGVPVATTLRVETENKTAHPEEGR